MHRVLRTLNTLIALSLWGLFFNLFYVFGHFLYPSENQEASGSDVFGGGDG